MLDTPILFIVFNRPETTQKVFDSIRTVKPKKLYIASDGPRKDIATDYQNCVLVREIVGAVDWECDVKKWYRDENIGFSKNIKAALDWFFTEEEAGIILEDDCLPSPSFYKYCELMLQKHKDNKELTLIVGSNFCDKPISDAVDYFIADFGYIWGWASWKSAVTSINWNTEYTLDQIRSKLLLVYKDELYVNYFYNIIEHFYRKRDCWDVELFVYNLMNDKKNIFPNVNLISNIGHTGTHYANSDNKLLYIKSAEIDFNKFSINNFSLLSGDKFKFVIKEFNNKVNALSISEKLLLFRNKLIEKIKRH